MHWPPNLFKIERGGDTSLCSRHIKFEFPPERESVCVCVLSRVQHPRYYQFIVSIGSIHYNEEPYSCYIVGYSTCNLLYAPRFPCRLKSSSRKTRANKTFQVSKLLRLYRVYNGILPVRIQLPGLVLSKQPNLFSRK